MFPLLNTNGMKLKRYSDYFRVRITRRVVLHTIDDLAVGNIFRERSFNAK